MKPRLLYLFVPLSFFFFFVSALSAQEIAWLSHYGSSSNGWGTGFEMAADGEGNIFVAGNMGVDGITMDDFTLTAQGNYGDILVAKLDSTGHTIWAVSAPNDCGPYDAGAVHSAHFDGNTQQLLISGVLRGQTTFGTHTFTSDCLNAPAHFIAAYNTDGNCNWVQGSTSGQLIMGPLLMDPVSDILAFGHNPYMTATFTGGAPMTVGEGAFVAHYNASGVLLGLEHIMNTGEVYDAAMIGNDWLLCGICYPGDSLWNTPFPTPPAGGGGFLAKTTPQGQVEWLASVSSDSSVNISGCVVLPSGKAIVYGTTNGSVYFDTDTLVGTPGLRSAFVARFDQQGLLDWFIPVTAPPMMSIGEIILGPDETVYIKGKFHSTLHFGDVEVAATTGKDAYVARLDTNGNVLGLVQLGRVMQIGSGSILANENGVFLSNMFDSTIVYGPLVVPVPNGGTELVVVKFQDVEGFTGIPSTLSLGEGLLIYANPNKGTCNIDLPPELLHDQGLVLRILDAQGRVVQESPLNITEGTVHLDIRAQAAGTYVVEVGNGNKRYTGRIVFE